METTSLTFGAPEWLWGFAFLPLIAALFVWSHHRSCVLVGKVVAPRLREHLAGSVSVARRILRAGLLMAVLTLSFLALAKPQYGIAEQEIQQKGRDIIIAVDTSRSMLASDISPDRLTRAKLLTQDFLSLVKGDRVGLVAFAGSAFLQAPLTLDHTAILNALAELDTNIIPKGGTNIASAITIAEKAFGKAEGSSRALIILTDGEELDADGISAAKKAGEQGIRIFTVGLGSPEGSLISIRTPDGRQDFVRDSAGKPVQSKLDSARLSEIASTTGGFYTPIGPEVAREIFDKGIEPMDVSEKGMMSSRQPIERYQWPLGFATAILVAWLLVGERRRRGGFARPAVAVVCLCLLPALHADPLQQYATGDYDKAREAFETKLAADPESRELQFNTGAAAYKAGDFPRAVGLFTSSLLSDDPKLREESSYNLANALVRRGEAAKDPATKKSDWTNALEHYTSALDLNPKNKQAEENRDLVKKLLEDLDKQQNEEQKKDEEEKPEDKKDQEKNDQEKKDEQKKDQDKKDEQKDPQKDQQGGGEDQKKDEDKSDEKKPEEEKKDSKDGDKGDKSEQDNKPGEGDEKNDQKKDGEPEPATPSPTPGDKKQGDVKANNDEDPKEEKAQQAQESQEGAEPEPKEGEMSAAQARSLLNSLRSEEEKVNVKQATEDVLRDW